MELSAEPEVLADGTPVRLGRYRLVRPISTGGMARVFEARRESLAGVSPRVAIKVILPDYAQHDGFQRLFIHEARVGSMLAHPNLVQIQDFDCQDTLYYLVMEFVEGITLRRAISLCRRHGIPVPVHVVAEIGRQICDGLAHAHQACSEDGQALRLVHRDLKPGNLMLNPQGVVKLLDFGISKAHLLAEREGAVRGTWGYMPPEQAMGVGVGPAADLFGLAAVLYELAVLQPLFPEKEPDGIRALMDQDEAARRASALTGPLSPLSAILVRALQRDPAARFGSASAMGRALSALIIDPVTARDRLVRFQRDIQARAEAGLEGRAAGAEGRTAGADGRAAGATTGASTGASQASAASLAAARPPDSPGLPLGFGTPQGPRPVLDLRARGDAETSAARPGRPWLSAGLTSLALIVLAFTAWRLFAPASLPVSTVAPSPSPLSQLDGVVPAPPPAASPPPAPSPPVVAAVAPSAPAPSPPVVAAVAPSVPAPTPAPAPAAAPATTAPAAAPATTAPATTAPATTTSASPEAIGLPVAISSEPRSEVVIDKVPRGLTPLVGLPLSAGRHAVTLEAPDGRRATFTIDVANGTANTWVYDFESRGFR